MKRRNNDYSVLKADSREGMTKKERKAANKEAYRAAAQPIRKGGRTKRPALLQTASL